MLEIDDRYWIVTPVDPSIALSALALKKTRSDAMKVEVGCARQTYKPSKPINFVTPPRMMKTATAKFTMRLTHC
jgi:hypothetical protein